MLRGRYHGPGVGLVLVRQQQIDAAPEKLRVLRTREQGKALRRTLPLLDEGFPRSIEWDAERLCERAHCIVPGRTEGEPDREFGTPRSIEAAGQRNIPIESRVVLPIETVIVSEIGP